MNRLRDWWAQPRNFLLRYWLERARRWLIQALGGRPFPVRDDRVRELEEVAHRTREAYLEQDIVRLQEQRATTDDRVRALEDVVRRARPAIAHLRGSHPSFTRLAELLRHMDQLLPPAPPLDDTAPPQRVRLPDSERRGYEAPTDPALLAKVALYDSDPEAHSELLTNDEAQRVLIGQRAYRRKHGIDS